MENEILSEKTRNLEESMQRASIEHAKDLKLQELSLMRTVDELRLKLELFKIKADKDASQSSLELLQKVDFYR